MNLSLLRKTKVVLPILFFIVFYAGWLVGRSEWDSESRETANQIVRLGPYKLVNPLLACEDAGSNSRLKQMLPFKKKVQQLIADEIKSGEASDVALYFRDFSDGTSLEFNPDDTFEPASLSKVPLMIAYLKLAEKNPGILKKKLVYDGKDDSTTHQFFKPKKTLEPGKAYTVEELIRLMIAYSDNNSWNLLLKNMDERFLRSMFKDLGAELNYGPGGELLVTVKSYAIFLRVLYNASYLGKEMSDKALEFMTGREFPFGIVSSIPSGITVADKFGERGTQGPKGMVLQLHDFGIVYYPERPYLLSIMTRGSDYKKLEKVIHDVSQLIFKEFDARNAHMYR